MRRNSLESERIESSALRAVGMERLLGSRRDLLTDLRDQAALAERHGAHGAGAPDVDLLHALRCGRYR